MKRKSVFLSFTIIQFFTAGSDISNNQAAQSVSVVQSIGTDIYQQFISSHTILAPTHNPEAESVSIVTNRIITAVKNYHIAKKTTRELEGFNWEISLVDDKKANGWCFPGGKIAIYSGLLPITQSDGSLAVVVAHEIAHILLKHGDARMKQYLKQYLGSKDLPGALAAKPAETWDFYRMAFGNGDYVGVIRGFGADEEIQADQLAAIFCAMAGYKAAEAVVFMERMLWFRNTGRTPEFILTHPVDEKRIPVLKEIVDDIQRNYYRPISKN